MHRKAKSLNSGKICQEKVRTYKIPHVFSNNGSFLVSVHRNRAKMQLFFGFASFPRRARRFSKYCISKSAGQCDAVFRDLPRSSKDTEKNNTQPKKSCKNRLFSCTDSKKYPNLAFLSRKCLFVYIASACLSYGGITVGQWGGITPGQCVAAMRGQRQGNGRAMMGQCGEAVNGFKKFSNIRKREYTHMHAELFMQGKTTSPYEVAFRASTHHI